MVSGLAMQMGRMARCNVCLDGAVGGMADGTCLGEPAGTTIWTGQYEIPAFAVAAFGESSGVPLLVPSTECHDHVTGFPVLAPLRCAATVCTTLTDLSVELRSRYA